MSNLPAVPSNQITTGHEIIQLVSFELEQEEYGVDVLSVREIIRMPSITKMPNTPDYVDGIINLRGTVVPIISLRRRFNLMDAELSNRSRILVMDISGALTGFIVDSVAEVIRISAAEIQPPPQLVSGSTVQECVTGVANHAERLLIVLDLVKLFTPQELSNLQW